MSLLFDQNSDQFDSNYVMKYEPPYHTNNVTAMREANLRLRTLSVDVYTVMDLDKIVSYLEHQSSLQSLTVICRRRFYQGIRNCR